MRTAVTAVFLSLIIASSQAQARPPVPPEAALVQLGTLLEEAAGHLAIDSERDAESLYVQALFVARSDPALLLVAGSRTFGDAGMFYESVGRRSDAARVYREGIELLEGAGSEPSEVAALLSRLGRAHLANESFEDAEPVFRRLLPMWETLLGPERPEVVGCRYNLAEICRMLGRHHEAEALHREVLKARKAAFGERSLEVADSLRALGVLLTEAKRFPDAESLLWEAMALCQEAAGGEHPLVVEALSDLVELYRAQGREDQALPLVERAGHMRARLEERAELAHAQHDHEH